MILTPAQARVAAMRAAGISTSAIAVRLGVSVSTIGQHVRAIGHRLGTHDRRTLARLLPDIEVRCAVRQNRLGLRRGDVVRITGGRFAGRVGAVQKLSNSRQLAVQIGGGTFHLDTRFVEREAA